MIKITCRYILFCLLILNINSQGQCYRSGEYIGSLGQAYSSVTSPKLDNTIKNELLYLEAFFGMKIDFFYLQEEYSTNAFYTRLCSSPLCEGTVFLGLNLLSEQFLNEKPFAFKATLAHEFAHALQFKMGHNGVYKRPELHADFIAGYYIGKTYNLSNDELVTFLSEFASLGDYNFFDLQHHGTPYERECAFKEGFFHAKEIQGTLYSAYSFGWSYVEANNPCIVRSINSYNNARSLQIENYNREQEISKKEHQRKVDEINTKISNKEVGKLTISANDSNKYRIVTHNIYRKPVITCINCNTCSYKAGSNSAFWRLTNTNISDVGYILERDDQPIMVYRKVWILGYRYFKVGMFLIPIKIGKTTAVEINKGRVTYTIN
jgi:hypothetical protein